MTRIQQNKSLLIAEKRGSAYRRRELIAFLFMGFFSPLSACNSLLRIMGLVHVHQGENNQCFIFSYNLLVMLSFQNIILASSFT